MWQPTLQGGLFYCDKFWSFAPTITTANNMYQSILLIFNRSAYPAPSMANATQISETALTVNWVDQSDGPAPPTGYRIERANYSSGCGSFSQIGTVGAGTMSYSDSGLSASTTYCYRVRGYDADSTGAYSAPYQITTPSSSLVSCGTSGSGCYDDAAAKAAGYALLPDGTTQVNYVPTGNNGFYVWQENDSPNRILQASGVWASSSDWQQTLNINGKGFSGTGYSSISTIAGRACPANGTLASVYIDDSNKVATGYCLYYDDGMNGVPALNAAGTSQTTSGQIGLGPWSTARWYEGNVQSCANKGMRLPTVYETQTTNTSDAHYPTDALPTFAESNGVPLPSGSSWSWTASASTYSVNDYWVWSGTL